MNWLKIQTEIIKALYSMVVSMLPVKLFFAQDEKSVLISLDAIVLYRIPKDIFLIDLTRLNITESNGVKTYVNKFSDAKPITDTFSTITRFINGKKCECRVFKFSDGTKLYVDSKILKNFPLDECKFSAENSRSLMYIQYDGQLVGGVMPLRVTDDEAV